jgi:hypothetical protein
MGNKGRLELRCDLASITDFPNLNSISKPSLESHRALSMGRDRDKKLPIMRFNPAKGLVKLFSRTGRRHKNPSTANTQPLKLSYAEVLWTMMDNRVNTSLDNCPGMAHRGHGRGGNRAGQVGTFGRALFHRHFTARGGPQFQGARGGGWRFDQRGHHGRGFDGGNRFQQERSQQTRWEEVHNDGHRFS